MMVSVRSSYGLLLAVAFLGVFWAQGCATHPAGRGYDATNAAEAQALVDKSARAVADMLADEDYVFFRDTLPSARGVFIVPNFYRLGFIFGAAGGQGVLLARDETGTWGPPAFYRLLRGSFGWLAGVEKATLVFVMTDEAVVEESLESGPDFGMGIGLTFIEDVARTGVETRVTDKPVYLFTRSEGLYGGMAFQGGRFGVEAGLNESYYRADGVTPRQIVMERAVAAPGAAELIRLLSVPYPREDVPVLE